ADCHLLPDPRLLHGDHLHDDSDHALHLPDRHQARLGPDLVGGGADNSDRSGARHPSGRPQSLRRAEPARAWTHRRRDPRGAAVRDRHGGPDRRADGGAGRGSVAAQSGHGQGMSTTLGVDVGGTFTDFFLVDEATGETRTHKVASTPDDPSRAILEGLATLVPAGGLAFLAHGTTVATNALIQRRGGKVALLTTAGFKDLLEIGRQTRPKIYDLKADHPEPLVPRERRFEVAERIGPAGEVIRPLAAAEVERAVAQVQASGAESVAVCFLFSFLNPEHELMLGRALKAALPGLDISLSCQIQPEFREYERLSTTVLNAYLQPVAGRYMGRLEKAVAAHAAGARIGICQSSGGLMSVARAAEMPIRTALSGPAAGVVGAVAAGARSGRGDLITFDMGGTSTDVCLVRGGKAEMAFGRSAAGFPVRLTAIDIHTVGAGGGSVAHIGRDGLMRVGPMSTGAVPGPACYGKGGSEPTVSDANLVLGRLPEELIGGGMRLDRSLAEAAMAPLAQRLGLTLR